MPLYDRNKKVYNKPYSLPPITPIQPPAMQATISAEELQEAMEMLFAKYYADRTVNKVHFVIGTDTMKVAVIHSKKK